MLISLSAQIGGSRLTDRDRQGFGWWDNLYNKAAASVQVDPTVHTPIFLAHQMADNVPLPMQAAPTTKSNASAAKSKPTANYGAPSFVKAEHKVLRRRLTVTWARPALSRAHTTHTPPTAAVPNAGRQGEGRREGRR